MNDFLKTANIQIKNKSINLDEIKLNLEEGFKLEHKKEWLEKKKEEYDSKYLKTVEKEETISYMDNGIDIPETVTIESIIDEGVGFENWLILKEPCNVCDTDIDDGTCPVCNGEGEILLNEYKPLNKNQIAEKIDLYFRKNYSALRAREYPSIYDWLDAEVKGDEAAKAEYKRKCKEVKEKYPKEMK